MIVKRPNLPFGIAHGTLASGKYASDVSAGSAYCKSLKVPAMYDYLLSGGDMAHEISIPSIAKFSPNNNLAVFYS